MTYLAKMNLGRPVGLEALRTVPDMVLQMEDVRSIGDEPWRFIFWASGDDFETYEAALTEDPTIDSFTRLTELPDRRLYRASLSEKGQRKTLHPITVEEDIVARSITITAESVEFLGRFPSLDALSAFRDACREKDREFTLVHLYVERSTEDGGGWGNKYGVTDAQREALLSALEEGYFSVPRQTTMKIIAETLGISTSALSTRLRRGLDALLRNTLTEEPIV